MLFVGVVCFIDAVCCQLYLTFLPKADKIVWDFRDDVAVLVADGAAADFWLGIEHLLAQLLQLSVVTVKEQVSSQLFGTLHRTETTVSPETVSLRWAQEAKTFYQWTSSSFGLVCHLSFNSMRCKMKQELFD